MLGDCQPQIYNSKAFADAIMQVLWIQLSPEVGVVTINDR